MSTESNPLPELKNWPLMSNNIPREDLDTIIRFLQQDDVILTQSQNVAAFEQVQQALLVMSV